MARYTTNDTNSPDQLTITDGVVTGNTNSYSGFNGTVTADRPNIQLCLTGAGGGPTCDRVESVVVTDIAPRQATINWTGGSGSYSIEYKAASADRWESVTELTGNSYVLTNLEPATSYSVSVYNVCGAENVSKARTASFTTSCDVDSSFS